MSTNHIVKTSRPIWIHRRLTAVAVAVPAQRRGTAVAKTGHESITIDDWTPPEGGYDLVALWVKGRAMHPAAEQGEIELIEKGFNLEHRHWEIRTGRIGAVFAAIFGKRAVEAMPEYDLMITMICRALPGCTRQELEAL